MDETWEMNKTLLRGLSSTTRPVNSQISTDRTRLVAFPNWGDPTHIPHMYHVMRRLSALSLTKPRMSSPTFIPATFIPATAHPLRPAVRAIPLRRAHRFATAAPHRRASLHPRRQQVRAAAQQDTAWNEVKVLQNSAICEDHRYIAVSVGVTSEKGSLTDSYRIPGMYVQIRPDESTKPGFFAISCAPNIQGVFEFLIKETPNVEWFTSCKEGDVVEMSPVQGKGFPMSKLDMFSYPALPEDEVPRDILLFATGSGIAPIRATIESMLNGLRIPQRRSVKLFYGARYPRRMAYMDRFKLWESDGVEVIPVMSRPELAEEAWEGRSGYVQDALKDIGIEHPKETGVLLCGVKGMTEDVTKMLVEAGVPKDRILTNF